MPAPIENGLRLTLGLGTGFIGSRMVFLRYGDMLAILLARSEINPLFSDCTPPVAKAKFVSE